MKKNSKVIRKKYTNNPYENDAYKQRSFYGLFINKGRVKIDPKRYANTFNVPQGMNDKRNSVYFCPYKEHYSDYNVNYFLDAIETSNKIWIEQKVMIHKMIKDYIDSEIKKPSENYDDLLHSGILEPDEWQSANRMASIMHQVRIEAKINEKIYDLTMTLYSQTIHMMASHLEHAMVETMHKNGYEGDQAGRNQIYKYVENRVKKGEEMMKFLPNFKDWDKFYSLWNFIKHNSLATYNKILKNWPELLYQKDKDKNFKFDFPSKLLAIHYLKINDEFIDGLFEPLKMFYEDFCEFCYQEPKGISKWNYDDYFISVVDSYIKSEIELINNPLGIPLGI